MNYKKVKIKFKKFIVRYFSKYCSPYLFTDILREEGISIGKGTIFYDPNSQTIDRERPWMLKIGEYCKITKGTTILTHDYSRSVLRRVYGDIVGEAGITKIGNNVFVGMHSTILMGADIGDNVIIGAGSVVSGKVESNCVVAGNPAKVIRTLDEHYSIRKNKYINEAKIYASEFIKDKKRKPTIQEMNAFFPLYLERNIEVLKKSGINTKLNGDEENEIIEYFLNTEPKYKDYSEFINEVINETLDKEVDINV